MTAMVDVKFETLGQMEKPTVEPLLDYLRRQARRESLEHRARFRCAFVGLKLLF